MSSIDDLVNIIHVAKQEGYYSDLMGLAQITYPELPINSAVMAVTEYLERWHKDIAQYVVHWYWLSREEKFKDKGILQHGKIGTELSNAAKLFVFKEQMGIWAFGVKSGSPITDWHIGQQRYAQHIRYHNRPERTR